MKKGYCKSSITALPKVLCLKAKNNRPCYEACCALRKKIERMLNFVYTLVFYPISMVIMQNNIDITQFSNPPPDISRFARLTWTYAHINTLTHPGWNKTNAVMVVVLEGDSICDRTPYIMLFSLSFGDSPGWGWRTSKRSRCVYWEPNIWVDTKTQNERKGLTLMAWSFGTEHIQ